MEDERRQVKEVLSDLMEMGEFVFDPFEKEGKNFQLFSKENGSSVWLNISFVKINGGTKVSIRAGYFDERSHEENDYLGFLSKLTVNYFLLDYDDIFHLILGLNIGKNFKIRNNFRGHLNKKNMVLLKSLLVNIALYKILKLDFKRVFILKEDVFYRPGFLTIIKNHPCRKDATMSLCYGFEKEVVFNDGVSFSKARVHFPYNQIHPIVRKEFEKNGIIF